MEPVLVTRGHSPLVLAMPHVGTFVPDDITATLNAEGRRLRDADWHIERLYADLVPEASVVQATHHRYCIDLNRAPSQESLYPGQNTTDLVPLTDFDGQPIWQKGKEPDAEEIARRRAAFHTPYHAALTAEIARVKAIHGVAILYDCHSIRSHIPYLFEGQLPDLNIGTNSGQSCDKRISDAVADLCLESGFSSIVNGRFKGGWTTRHYGQPEHHVHAIQMEMTQALYLVTEAEPFFFDDEKAARLRPLLRHILENLIARAHTLAHKPEKF
ncbi:MAG: N-formylglutamate deformylase [Rhizomicrobium sp.]